MKEFLSIKELEVILDVVATRNLSHTARNTGVAQANISRMIIGVEERYGLEIFDRSARPMQLTSFGMALIPYIRNHMISYTDMTAFMDGYKNELSGVVRLNIPTGHLYFVSKYIIPKVVERYPEIKVDIYTTNLKEEDYLRGVYFDDKCDIMFTHALPQNNNLVAFKLVEVSCNIYCTKYFLAQHPVINADQYSDYPCILFHSFMSANKNTWPIYDLSTHEALSLRVDGNIICDNAYTAIELAKADLGFIYMPDVMLGELELAGELVPTLPENYTAKILTYVIYRKRKIQPERVTAVIDIITESMKEVIGKKII